MARAVECCRDAGGLVPEGAVRTRNAAESEGGDRDGAAGAWRQAFLQAPYLRDLLVSMSVLVETFETAITWDRFESFHRGVMSAANDAVKRVCGAGSVACRFTHVYPDGPAPYYTLLAPARRDLLLKQTAERESESQRLSKAALQPDGAMIVAGDFNMPVESHFFREHWRGFRNAFSTVGFGFGHTTHVEAGGKIPYGARIDHILTRGNWHARRCWVGFDVGSDHLPLLADVYWSE